MTDIAEQQPALPPGTGIAEVAIDLDRGQSVTVIKLRSPGIVRAAAFWLKTPTVLGSASMRAVEKIPMPLLFVECDPAGEMRDHVFAFLPSNAPFAPRDGYRAEYRASAIQGGVGCVHVYELVKQPVAEPPPPLSCGCAAGRHGAYRNLLESKAEDEGPVCSLGWSV